MQQVAYCDESGKHLEAKIFIMSGLVAPSTKWDRFSESWLSVLNKKGMKCFHATDCENGYGEFQNMSLAEREAIQECLINVIRRSGIHAISTAIKRVDYAGVAHRLRTDKKYQSIYFLGFEAAVVHMLDRAGTSEVAFVFDRQKEYQGRAKELFDLMCRHPTYRSASRLGSLVFEPKEKAIPLQASDLFAYESYRFAIDPPTRKPRWQIRLLREMKPRPGIGYLTRPFLEKLASRMERERESS